MSNQFNDSNIASSNGAIADPRLKVAGLNWALPLKNGSKKEGTKCQQDDFESTGVCQRDLSTELETEDERPTIDEMASWLNVLLAEDQVVELRAFGVSTPSSSWQHIESGYYDGEHLYEMAEAADELTNSATCVCLTLNPLNPDLLARRANRVAFANKGEAAADKDVVARRWLFVDVDPVRPGGISATDQEKAAARVTIDMVSQQLSSIGWPDPILADSGNGYHLLYRVELPADDGGLAQRVLQALADRFDCKQAKIDTQVANASRLVKAYGTMARKGDEIKGRPHRPSRILVVPSNGQVVPRELLESLAGEIGTSSPKSPKANSSTIVASQDGKQNAYRHETIL
jgi:hypothetical protein